MKHTTFDDRLVSTGGRPAGFDYLRIVLSVCVIFWHSFNLVGVHIDVIFRPLYAGVIPMFFALSGFLVAGSLTRSKTLISFLGLRVIRLVPALLVETVFSAIVIGLLFTTLPYKQYFSNHQFFQYFLNIVGDVHFYLPGVFKTNHVNMVNGQLWTIPWELRCYIAIALISIIMSMRRKYVFLALVVVLNAVVYIHVRHTGLHGVDPTARVTAYPGELVLVEFLYGIAFYLFRASVVWNKWLFLALVAFLLVVMSVQLRDDFITPCAIGYVTIYLGLLEPPRLKIVTSGDYSYGVYLYGYPIQQSLIASMGRIGLHWYVNFILATLIAGVIAIGSWHLVEKHAAQLRPALFRLEARIMLKLSAFRQKRPGSRGRIGRPDDDRLVEAKQGDA